jgi:hypothetical protein
MRVSLSVSERNPVSLHVEPALSHHGVVGCFGALAAISSTLKVTEGVFGPHTAKRRH